MSHKRSINSSDWAAVEEMDGCLIDFRTPLIAVILVGLSMICGLGGMINPQNSASNPDPITGNQAIVEINGQTTSNPLSGLSPVFTEEVQFWANSILRWSAEAGLDPNLVATVMQIESCGDPRALSRAGAMGLFQVMPYHFLTTDDPYAPDTNASRGLAYLQRSITKANGDPHLAFAGYNGGIGVIDRLESNWAAETQRYAYWGSGIYSEAMQGNAQSLRLDEWLAAGGSSLCRQAHKRLNLP